MFICDNLAWERLKRDEGFWCEFDQTAVDHLRHTHTLLTAPSQAL